MKKKTPLVSIACITFNHESYIRRCIDGFLMQKTTFPFEIIIHDDASTDNTTNILQEYVDKYPNLITLIFQKENQLSQKINPLFEFVFPNCQGKYIAFCEGDDYWTDAYKLQKQVAFLEANKDYGLVWTDVDFYLQSLGIFKKNIFRNKILPIYNSFNETLINKPYFAPPTWLFKREYLPKGINDYCDGTFPMILDILAETKIKYLDEVTATYRQLDESASNSRSALKRYKFLKGVYRIQKDYLNKYNVSNKIEKEIDLKHYEAAYPYAVIFKDIETIERGKLIFKNNPHNSIKIRCTLILSNFFLGIYILKILYNNTQLKNLVANLPIFKHS